MSIDYTLVVQIALFVALWVVLKRLWFDPALRVIRERTARSEGAVREARAIQAEAERQRLIAEARAEAQRTLTDVRAQVAEEVASARLGLRDSAGEIARIVT